MPSRSVPLVTGEYYHVFNRGVARVPIFSSGWDYQRFIQTFLYYQLEFPPIRFSLFDPKKHAQFRSNKHIIEMLCYCLMPNHFHFLLKQTKDGGVTQFLSKLTNSYTKYINTKNNRVGPLFQGEFKAIHLETDQQLAHLSRYIHLNPLVGYVCKVLDNYRWSSYQEYLDFKIPHLCKYEEVISQFSSPQDYQKFCLDQADYARELESIKHLSLDFED